MISSKNLVFHKNHLWLLVGFLSLITLGFLREYIFEGINAYLGALYYQHENPSARFGLGIIEHLDYWQLFYLKFPLTLITALLFFLISYLSLKKAFTSLPVFLYTSIFFGIVFLLSLTFYGLAYLMLPEKMYNVSRRLAEFIQSPLALMVLYPAFLILSKADFTHSDRSSS